MAFNTTPQKMSSSQAAPERVGVRESVKPRETLRDLLYGPKSQRASSTPTTTHRDSFQPWNAEPPIFYGEKPSEAGKLLSPNKNAELEATSQKDHCKTQEVQPVPPKSLASNLAFQGEHDMCTTHQLSFQPQTVGPPKSQAPNWGQSEILGPRAPMDCITIYQKDFPAPSRLPPPDNLGPHWGNSMDSQTSCNCWPIWPGEPGCQGMAGFDENAVTKAAGIQVPLNHRPTMQSSLGAKMNEGTMSSQAPPVHAGSEGEQTFSAVHRKNFRTTQQPSSLMQAYVSWQQEQQRSPFPSSPRPDTPQGACPPAQPPARREGRPLAGGPLPQRAPSRHSSWGGSPTN
ncbi:protein piccolo-like [Tachyglossus aculeatus]|uniref:protein piccolo-like n=1 Tax=Tachyglossus aculeatus TaxID=9261 RepID=UPI0018F31FEB|nr:protein piccolo-like [Tachyglossus aculeatus]